MSGKSPKSSLNKLTTKQSRERLRHKLIRVARWTVALGAVALGGYAVMLVGSSSIESELFKLDEIEYEGAEHLDLGPLNEMIAQTFSDNVLKIRLERLRNLVESENWVQTATVRRRLPNRIQVRVNERKPVAIAALDNELFVVDADGLLLATYGSSFDFLDLPIVRGLQNTALENAQAQNAERMRVFLTLVDEFRSGGGNYLETLSEIDVSDVERVAVVPTEDPVPIGLGDRRFRQRYQVFLDQIDLYREVRESSGGIESVDVTFDDKIIIQTVRGKKSRGSES